MPLEVPYSVAEQAASQAALRDAVLQEAQRVSVGGPAWTLYRTTGNGITAAPTSSTIGTRTAYVIRHAPSRMQPTLPGSSLWDSDWLIVAPLGQDIRAGDLLSDGTQAFLVTSAPENDLGLLIAPAERTALPA